MAVKALKHSVIRNAKGEIVKLNPLEQRIANLNQKVVNGLGVEVNITTLTTISKLVTDQKFYHIPPAKYVPLRVGEGAWSTNLTTYRSFVSSDAFETGIVQDAMDSTRLASADAAVDSLNIKVFNWAKQLGYSIMELAQAQKAQNWDLVTAREEARKTNWDLGIQKIAFLGANGQNGSGGTVLGLLNQSAAVTTNTTLITAPISGLSTTNLKAFCAGIVEAYRSNCQRTAYPTHFVIPESDYNGLASQSSPDFPIKSVLEVLLETFKLICQNPEFKILPLAYADMAYSGFGYQIYALYNADPKSLRMDIPVDYTNTIQNTVNGFNYSNVGYGQFTGVLAYRPLELLYFTYVP